MHHRYTITMAGLAVLLSLLFVVPARGADFSASFRDSAGLFLVTPIGVMFRSTPPEAPKQVFTFSYAAGRPYRWARAIRSIVKWRSEWLVADGTNRIARFRPDGVHTGVTDAPFRIASLAVAAGRVWALNMLAMNSQEQLWFSTDGKVFTPLRTPEAVRFESPLANLLILAGGSAGDVYVAPVVGPPIARHVWPEREARTIPLAYSRTKHRMSLEEIVGLIDDVTPYSQPVRDLLVGESGEVFILRNREDVSNSAGTIETIVGRRVDRYSARGRHMATAVLPATARWICRIGSADVVAVSNTGSLLTAKWGRPLPAEVLSH